MPPPIVNVFAAAGGALAHTLYFNRNEHHMYGVRYLQGFLILVGLGIGFMVRILDVPFRSAFSSVSTVTACFLGGLYTSLLFYRVVLHPLNKFPGPFPARFSNLWYTSQVAGAAIAHKKMLELHGKYGDFVRIGSSDLSIIHPLGPQAIYGPGTKCTKAYWYDGDTPLNSMHTSRNRTHHDKRRRIWSPAFSDKALRGYETRIRPYGDKLIQQLKAFSGKPVNVSDWFNFYSFDVMGDLAFGESFNMLERGEAHWAIKLLNEGMEPLHLMLPTWMFRVLTAIPGLSAGYWKFIGFCSQQLDNRMKKKVETPDIMSSLLEPYANSSWPQGQELTYLQADSRLIIVAGSDTTAATLTHVFYHLAADSSRVQKLRDEVFPYVDDNGDVSHKDIVELPYLNGVINEAMRLNPPVPSAVQRLTPPEGIHVGETFVPGNMIVWCPQYVMARSEKVYQDAYTFYPERWYQEPDMVKEKTAFAPFSLGVYGCIGKPLALMELRTIITKIVTHFDVAYGPGEDGTTLQRDTRDHFTLGLAPLNISFTKRK